MIYRLKQVWDNIFGELSPAQRLLVEEHLDGEELDLFRRLERADQYHSVKVAESALELMELDKVLLDRGLVIKASLLHDVGKVDMRLSLLDRVMPVLVTKISSNGSRLLGSKFSNNSIRRGFYIYWHHPQRGADFAREKKIAQEIIDVIIEHQDEPNLDDCPLVRLVKKADQVN